MNLIGDVAGNYLTFVALLDKMPKDCDFIQLGDPNDRGPRSKEVIEFLMNNGQTIFSNHAHMMVEEWKQQHEPRKHQPYYSPRIWPESNGGMNTIFSYNSNSDSFWNGKVDQLIPKDHIMFLENCPRFIETDEFIATHAPIHITLSAEEASNLGSGFTSYLPDPESENSVIWNRQVPNRVNPKLKGKINIFGHNASQLAKVYTTEFPDGLLCDQDKLDDVLSRKDKFPIYAICLDTSRGTGLTGLHYPTMKLYFQEFID